MAGVFEVSHLVSMEASGIHCDPSCREPVQDRLRSEFLPFFGRSLRNGVSYEAGLMWSVFCEVEGGSSRPV